MAGVATHITDCHKYAIDGHIIVDPGLSAVLEIIKGSLHFGNSTSS